MKRRIRLHRALPLVLLAPLAAACGGGNSVTGTTNNPSGSASVASVTVSPSRDTLASIDATVTFSAQAKNASGATISGASFSWSSTRAGVATVSSSGTATAKQNGTTRIIASVSGKADTAVLVVQQRTATVVVSPDSVRVSAAGDTVRFTASPQDGNGHPVAGVTLGWSVSDSSVATVDSTGLVTAKALGRVSVSATAAGTSVSGSGVFRVAVLGVPNIQSVSPTPLQAGQAATITGQNFDPAVVGDSVQIDGLAAVVTASGPTSLQVTVPTYDCLPPRTVTVRLATDGGVAQATSALEPAQTPVSVSVGHQALITDPAAFCLQFSAAADSESYLVGVQSLSSTASSLTPVQITGEAANGSGAASVARASVATRVVPLQGTSGGASLRTPSWLVSQQRAEMRIREWERTHLDPHLSIPATGSAADVARPRFSVSGTAAVGDTVPLRVPSFGSDLCANYTDVTATVRVIGQKAIIVADIDNPANGFTQADYQHFSDMLDQKVFSTDEAYFGSPGDIDNNGHVVILFTKAVNAETTGPNFILDGFVFPGDLFPRVASSQLQSGCASSDQGEIYYGRVPDPDSLYGYPTTRTGLLYATPRIMAHELVHLIQDGRRFALNLSWMSSPIAEAQAVLGEEVVGHAETGNQPYQNYGVNYMLGSAGAADSVQWYYDKFADLLFYYGFNGSTTTGVDGAPEQCGWWQSDPSPCQARPLWYGVGWSFLRWVSDQYGPGYPGSGEKSLQTNIISDPGTGFNILTHLLDVPVSTLMARWSAALYMDDRISGVDPALTFTSWNLQDLEQRTVATEHLRPIPETFGDWTTSSEVRASSAAYLLVSGKGRPATAVKVRDASGNPLPSYMQVWVVRVH